MLEVSDIHVDYGGVHALTGLTLAVREKQMVALIGSNGAGKTTLLNTISGALRPTRGSITFEGAPITGKASHRIARLGLLHVPEGRQILAPLSVDENLALGRLALGKRDGNAQDDLARVYRMFPILEKRRLQAGGSLSGGEQQMLAIGRALMGRPRLLLLDEPSLGLSPLITQQVFQVLRQLADEGLTILLIEQNARRALAVTDHAYVIDQGRIVQSGTSKEIASDSTIVAHYLGQTPGRASGLRH